MSITATQVLDAGESHRRELTAYCYRFFGSYPEAEDAVQEVLVKAWHGAEGFRGGSSLRTWLYRIATNTCLDMRKAPQRRALPMDLAAPGDVPRDPSSLTTAPVDAWIGPIADARLVVRGPGRAGRDQGLGATCLPVGAAGVAPTPTGDPAAA